MFVVPLHGYYAGMGIFDSTFPCSPATLLLSTTIFGARSLIFEGGKSLLKGVKLPAFDFSFWKAWETGLLDVMQCCEDTCSGLGAWAHDYLDIVFAVCVNHSASVSFSICVF